MLKTNPDDVKFIEAIKNLSTGETVEVEDGILEVEYIFDIPSHFPFHQRIFEPGMILKKQGSNVRIYVEAEKLGMEVQQVERHEDGSPKEFDDQQITAKGKVLPAERGEGYEDTVSE